MSRLFLSRNIEDGNARTGTFRQGIGGFGGDQRRQPRVESKEDCCALCLADPLCTVAVYDSDDSMCHIKAESKEGYAKPGYWACRARPPPPASARSTAAIDDAMHA
jgi:hypothetical protein|eukprot:COSAG01_NODE_9225_length_2513_cov_9.411350_4_plen_106_part_00